MPGADIYDGEIEAFKLMMRYGFEHFTGKKKRIRPEFEKVFRIEVKEGFRIIGYFYSTFSEFHAIDCYPKKNQTNNKQQNNIIKKVADIKKKVLTKRIYKDE